MTNLESKHELKPLAKLKQQKEQKDMDKYKPFHQ
jgi:hypothetical protein